MKRDKVVLRVILIVIVLMSLASSIDWGDVWYRVWDVTVSILLCIWIWTVDIYYPENKKISDEELH